MQQYGSGLVEELGDKGRTALIGMIFDHHPLERGGNLFSGSPLFQLKNFERLLARHRAVEAAGRLLSLLVLLLVVLVLLLLLLVLMVLLVLVPALLLVTILERDGIGLAGSDGGVKPPLELLFIFGNAFCLGVTEGDFPHAVGVAALGAGEIALGGLPIRPELFEAFSREVAGQRMPCKSCAAKPFDAFAGVLPDSIAGEVSMAELRHGNGISLVGRIAQIARYVLARRRGARPILRCLGLASGKDRPLYRR